MQYLNSKFFFFGILSLNYQCLSLNWDYCNKNSNSTASSSIGFSTNVSAVKIVDFFPFNGEPMAMLRLKYLYDVVDLFILIESNVTHSGNPKKHLFVNQYHEYLKPLIMEGKVIIEIVHFPDEIYLQSKSGKNVNGDSWSREMYQRNVGKELAFKHLGNDPFILLVSDADELPKKHVISILKNRYDNLCQPIKFQQILFYYSFYWMNKHPIWYGTFAVSNIFLRSSSMTLDYIRRLEDENSFIIYKDAGWHCSYCMNAQSIQNKILSFAHTEFKEYANDLKWIEKCRLLGYDLFRRKHSKRVEYNGKYGYPYCKTCSSIPEYKILQIPPQDSESYF